MRVEFRDAAARAIANARVQIGDEVILGLEGCHFTEVARNVPSDTNNTRDAFEVFGGIRTPGKCVSWELVFERRLVSKVTNSLDFPFTTRLDPRCG